MTEIKYKVGQSVLINFNGSRRLATITAKCDTYAMWTMNIVGCGSHPVHEDEVVPPDNQKGSWASCNWKPKTFIASMNEQQRILFILATKNTLKEGAKK